MGGGADACAPSRSAGLTSDGWLPAFLSFPAALLCCPKFETSSHRLLLSHIKLVLKLERRSLCMDRSRTSTIWDCVAREVGVSCYQMLIHCSGSNGIPESQLGKSAHCRSGSCRLTMPTVPQPAQCFMPTASCACCSAVSSAALRST